MKCSWGETGSIVITSGLNADCGNNPKLHKEVTTALHRYLQGDWGSLCAEDKQMNDNAVKNNNDRILAKYPTCNGNIYIITEWDRSYTTILYCNEY